MPDRTSSKNELFESMQSARALAVMAAPTILSQLIILLHRQGSSAAI